MANRNEDSRDWSLSNLLSTFDPYSENYESEDFELNTDSEFFDPDQLDAWEANGHSWFEATTKQDMNQLMKQRWGNFEAEGKYGSWDAAWSIHTIWLYLILFYGKLLELRVWKRASSLLKVGAWILLHSSVFVVERDWKHAKKILVKYNLITSEEPESFHKKRLVAISGKIIGKSWIKQICLAEARESSW